MCRESLYIHYIEEKKIAIIKIYINTLNYSKNIKISGGYLWKKSRLRNVQYVLWVCTVWGSPQPLPDEKMQDTERFWNPVAVIDEHLKGLLHEIFGGLFWHARVGLDLKMNLYWGLNFLRAPSISYTHF